MNADIRMPDAFSADDAVFLANHPPAAFLRSVRRRRARRNLARGAALGTALAACLAVVLASPVLHERDGATGMKGNDANIFAYRKSEGGIGLVGPKDALSAGDEIQVSYYARGRNYAAILSIDGRGEVTRHLPLHGDAALQIDTKEFELLPYSYRLDDAPRFEDLYLVVSPKPFAVSTVEPFLRAAFDSGTTAVQLPSPLRYATARIAKTEASE